MSRINIKQLQKNLKEEKQIMADGRAVEVQARMNAMYNPEPPEDKTVRWDYATLYYPRTFTPELRYGPTEKEGEELKSIGLEGWEMINFQVYSVQGTLGSQLIAEYVFKKKI